MKKLYRLVLRNKENRNMEKTLEWHKKWVRKNAPSDFEITEARIIYSQYRNRDVVQILLDKKNA